MTHTRATSPSLISSHCNRNTTTRDKSHRRLTCDSICAKLHIWLRTEGVRNDGYHDGRISYRRRSRQQTQNVRRDSKATLTYETDGRIQNQWSVACHIPRFDGVHRQTEEYSRRQEIIKAGITRLSKSLVAQLFSRRGKQLENSFSSRYPVSIMPYGKPVAQQVAIYWYGRAWVTGKVTSMSITIGIPSFQVYPYRANDAPSIFGVHGSEVAA
jgi:hypothetical protein